MLVLPKETLPNSRAAGLAPNTTEVDESLVEVEDKELLALVTPVHPDWISVADKITGKTKKQNGLQLIAFVRTCDWRGSRP